VAASTEGKSMYLREGKKKHYLPFFLHLCGHQTASIIIVYINLQSSSSSSSTNYKPNFGSSMMYLWAFILSALYVFKRPSVDGTFEVTEIHTHKLQKTTHQVDFGKPEILDLCGHYHLYTQYLLLCARYLSLTLLRSHKSPSNSLQVIPNQVLQKVFPMVL
jgi:hypothetical protein